MDPASLAARGDVHEGALGRGLHEHADRPRLRPRERPERPARPRGPAAEVTARLRDRLRPAEGRPPDHARAGGLHDYQAFLHEAGHALHFAGVDPSLPYTFRRIARDHALTEIYSYILEAITREPEWHARYFGLGDDEARENAEATTFLEAFLYRRYVAKLQYELGFWSRRGRRHPEGYEEKLTAATASVTAATTTSRTWTPASTQRTICAWIRHAQLREYLKREVGEDWWRSSATGDRLRDLFREGTKPSSEEIAQRLGFEPMDTRPLVSELTA